MRFKSFVARYRMRIALNGLFLLLILGASIASYLIVRARVQAGAPSLTANEAFLEASQNSGVPIELLKAICYMEGRLSNNNGVPSDDGGYGCMHLVKNSSIDMLNQAATDLNLSVSSLEQDMPTNILGGAAVLHDMALKLSSNQTLPVKLTDWNATLQVYSAASTHDIAIIFANGVYEVIQKGFTAQTDKGELVTLAPEAVQPVTTPTTTTATATATATPATKPTATPTATPTTTKPTATPTETPTATPGTSGGTATPTTNTTDFAAGSAAKQPDSALFPASTMSANDLPVTCVNKQTDSKVDYPGAIDCIVTPQTLYDCNDPGSPSNCAYTSSDRPSSCTVQTVVTTSCNIDQVVIHDTEGSLSSALNGFWCLSNSANRSTCQQKSVQYIVDTDGTIYQVLNEKDIAYHDGNFWSNTHSVGIEHIGVDATGYLWYNTTQYTASAKLVAYLLKKYHLQLNRDHVVAHSTVPASKLAESPNHVDPGPYWLWDYYFSLISQQGVPLNTANPPGTITLHPTTDQAPLGSRGAETSANYNFFKLYNGPGTNTGLIPGQGSGSDPTDVSYNVEAGMSYYYIAKAPDAAGTSATMYEIWYGEENLVHSSPSSFYINAKVAWLAVPPGAGVDQAQSPKPGVFYSTSLVEVTRASATIYGEPVSNSLYIVGGAPVGAIFYSGYTVIEDNSSNMWFEINFNHRHAWIPASEVTTFHP